MPEARLIDLDEPRCESGSLEPGQSVGAPSTGRLGDAGPFQDSDRDSRFHWRLHHQACRGERPVRRRASRESIPVREGSQDRATGRQVLRRSCRGPAEHGNQRAGRCIGRKKAGPPSGSSGRSPHAAGSRACARTDGRRLPGDQLVSARRRDAARRDWDSAGFASISERSADRRCTCDRVSMSTGATRPPRRRRTRHRSPMGHRQFRVQ